MSMGMPMEDPLNAGEVLRQASAVVGRPVILWEVTGVHEVVPRASSDPDASASLPKFDLEKTLRGWNVAIPVGSRWVASPGATPDAWVIAPVPSGMLAHQASNPLAAARAGLQLAMESIGRWVDLAADRRLALLDDLGQVLEDIDRTSELLRAVREYGSTRGAGASTRPERFDAVRVIRSCLTLERRLLRDRGIELDFTTALESSYIKGDPNALFDLLVNIVRNVADAGGEMPAPISVQLGQKGKDLEIIVHGRGTAANLAKVRSVTEARFGGSVAVESALATGTTLTIALPLPPQRQP